MKKLFDLLKTVVMLAVIVVKETWKLWVAFFIFLLSIMLAGVFENTIPIDIFITAVLGIPLWYTIRDILLYWRTIREGEYVLGRFVSLHRSRFQDYTIMDFKTLDGRNITIHQQLFWVKVPYPNSSVKVYYLPESPEKAVIPRKTLCIHLTRAFLLSIGFGLSNALLVFRIIEQVNK